MAARDDGQERYREAIRGSRLSIYDPIEVGDPDLWIPGPELEQLLERSLVGVSLAGLPIRTRSKRVKQLVCQALGYPVPESFKKTQPRFPGQFFDTYTQKSNNLQIWNEELAPTRRYAIVRVTDCDVVTRVRVVTGDTLARLDKTGKLTGKYQARLIPGATGTELVVKTDTERLRSLVEISVDLTGLESPVSDPCPGQLMDIRFIFGRLQSLVGERFADTGHDQERNRGAALHKLVCRQLGYRGYRDDGRFPDVRHQLLEVKLQTSPTIDLGLVCPDSPEALDVPRISGLQIRHCDVRYALFAGVTDGHRITLTHFFLTTGERFFPRFPQFGGNVLNQKLQIPLPADFFES